MNDQLEAAIAALPTPGCPLPAAETCSGKFERVASCSRPGELDVSVRCRECQAVAHYVLDEAGEEKASGVRHQASGDEHEVGRLNGDFHGPIEDLNHKGHEEPSTFNLSG